MSTTAILKWVHGQADGDLNRAIDLLTFENAKPARNVLLKKLKKHPQAKTFSFRHDGFVVVS